MSELSDSYDRVADEYVRRIYDELRGKPLDRSLLDRFALAVRDAGPACDLGCGPGHVARYLHERGVRICGVDLSPGMVEKARGLYPGVEFRVGDMLALGEPDGAWAGIVAFYSIIHVPPERLGAAFGEMCRVLRPEGLLLLSFHVGDEVVHLDTWWDRPVNVDFHFYRSEPVSRSLVAAGFRVEEIVERDPYPGVEHQSRRSYIFARRLG